MCFLGLCLTHGMMEYWNGGIMVFQRILSIYILSFGLRRAINPTFQYPKTQLSNVPSFQHSNWGEASSLYQLKIPIQLIRENFQRQISTVNMIENGV